MTVKAQQRRLFPGMYTQVAVFLNDEEAAAETSDNCDYGVVVEVRDDGATVLILEELRDCKVRRVRRFIEVPNALAYRVYEAS